MNAKKLRLATGMISLAFLCEGRILAADAPQLSIADCEARAIDYTDSQKPHNKELPLCWNTVFGQADSRTVRTTSTGLTTTVGYANMILLRDQNAAGKVTKVRAIGGSNTGLQDVRAIALNEKEGTLVALNYVKDRDGGRPEAWLYTFSSKLDGNINPIRRVYRKELDGAVSVSVDADDNLIVAMVPEQLGAIVLPLEASVDGRSPASEVKTLGWLKSGKTQLQDPEDIAYDPVDHAFLLSDTQGNQVVAYDAAGLKNGLGSTTPLWTIASVATLPATPLAVNYNSKKKSIDVNLSDGSTTSVTAPKLAQ
jgi:hypothetical protein